MLITSIKDLLNSQINCSSPHHDLVVYPKWIVFYSDVNYKKPCFVKFFIQNRDRFPVVYTIKSKQKLFKIMDSSCGILQPGEKKTFKLYLLAADDWPLGVNDYVHKHLKLAIENLRIPYNIKPENKLESQTIAKNIWKRSITEWPMERMYTKISVMLEKCE
ncbi:unnamed protein product [Caenorhabditis bovis]|uniref:MSP domain-containing protein n=1 Tax=Caenorhabditis bovis TaxID=2654633 RepID=A0A8S1EMB9_9PELO|nr:unnamed protein product [Caenorhabditis bovis]